MQGGKADTRTAGESCHCCTFSPLLHAPSARPASCNLPGAYSLSAVPGRLTSQRRNDSAQSFAAGQMQRSQTGLARGEQYRLLNTLLAPMILGSVKSVAWPVSQQAGVQVAIELICLNAASSSMCSAGAFLPYQKPRYMSWQSPHSLHMTQQCLHLSCHSSLRQQATAQKFSCGMCLLAEHSSSDSPSESGHSGVGSSREASAGPSTSTESGKAPAQRTQGLPRDEAAGAALAARATVRPDLLHSRAKHLCTKVIRQSEVRCQTLHLVAATTLRPAFMPGRRKQRVCQAELHAQHRWHRQL